MKTGRGVPSAGRRDPFSAEDTADRRGQKPEREDWSSVYASPAGSCVCQTDDEVTRYSGVDLDGVRAHWGEALG